jgi:sugar/nucleoside kinase (ribokinase family)
VSVYPVIPLAAGELVLFSVCVLWRHAHHTQVDENGAGDAYVGGFLAGLALGWSLAHCAAAASYCAWIVVQVCVITLLMLRCNVLTLHS